MQKNYKIPEQIVDAKEEKLLTELTDAYNKMIKPTKINEALGKLGEKVPASVKEKAGLLKNEISENELFIKSLTTLGKGFEVLEQYAAKITLSEKQIVEAINKITPDNEITTLDEICLARGYDISKVVDKYKMIDIGAAFTEGAATGAPGFAGIPFNLVLSTFLYYRAVQSIALFYGYDIKNDPAELQIASEVFMSALSPKNNNDSELSNAIAKVMLLTTVTSVKQTVKKGWAAMAEKGGVHLLLAQMRALANKGVRKTLEKAGKMGLEKTAFTEVFEQIGRKLAQKTILKAVPAVGALIGATLDTSQMIKIINFANIFYNKRFILEKDARINTLLGYTSGIIEVENFTEILDDEVGETEVSYGKPFIPGTTLAGVSRHHLEQCGYDTKDLFGYISEKPLLKNEELIYNKSESRIIFYEGFSNGNYVKSFRDGVRIKDGVADDGSKYDYEIIESGCEFSFRIEIDSFNDRDRQMLCSIINGFNNGFIRIGHKTNRGLGRVKVKTLKCKSVESIDELVAFNWEKVQDDFVCQNTKDNLHDVFSQKFTVRSFAMIANNATLKKKEDKLINAEQLKNAKEKAVIPGSSWAGVFRHHFIKILTQVSYNDADAFIDKLFGCTEQTSLIVFDESVIEKPVFMMQTRNAIDRFTAGASDKKLFTNELSFGGEVRLNIYLKKYSIGASILTEAEFELAKNLIELTVKDIDDGFVNIGGLGSVGGGLLKAVKVGDLE